MQRHSEWCQDSRSADQGSELITAALMGSGRENEKRSEISAGDPDERGGKIIGESTSNPEAEGSQESRKKDRESRCSPERKLSGSA